MASFVEGGVGKAKANANATAGDAKKDKPKQTAYANFLQSALSFRDLSAAEEAKFKTAWAAKCSKLSAGNRQALGVHEQAITWPEGSLVCAEQTGKNQCH